MAATDWNGFKGTAKRLDDVDLPRIGHTIGVGEDELHAFMDTESSGSGFDKQGRPKMLFEPHVFYRNLSGNERNAAVKAGLAYKTWGQKPYPKDSYARLQRAMKINETAALKAASWGLMQILGENHAMVGYSTVQGMVRAFMDDEEKHLEAAVEFLVAAGIDDELRELAALTRKTLPADTVGIVSVYNGPGYKKNNYHVKFADAHNRWRNIQDTPWSPGDALEKPIWSPSKDMITNVQTLLRDKGYHEVGHIDGLWGTRTRNTILAFQADNNLPLTGVISDALLAELVKAGPREIAPERAEVTEKELQKVEPTIGIGIWLRRLGAGLLAASGLGGIAEGTGDLDGAVSGVGQVGKLFESVLAISPWILLAIFGGVGMYLAHNVIKERVEAHRQGRAF